MLSETRRRIAGVLGDLSDRHHQIVLLRFFAGADWDEIAGQVGAPSAATVKKECLLRILPRVAAALGRR